MIKTLEQQRSYLAQLLEAIQRSAWFLVSSENKVDWPLTGANLHARRKDTELLETLAAINERFAKLQDTLAAAMRHSALLMNETTDSFLQVLVFFEKVGVVESVEQWQQARMVRNVAAHDYETDYAAIAEHFNTLAENTPLLLTTARRLITRVEHDLHVKPLTGDFKREFAQLFNT